MKKAVGYGLIIALCLSVAINVGLGILTYKNSQSTASTSASKSNKLLAKIEGQKLFEEDLIQKTPNIQRTREQLYRIKKQAVDQWVAEKAIELEAKRQKMPVGQLIQKIVAGLKVAVTEQEITAVIKQFGNAYPDPKDPTKKGPIPRPQARQYLTQMKQQQALRGKIEELRAAYSFKIYLEAPKTPKVKKNLALTNRPYSGNPNAKVKIVEFADFQCSACAYIYTSTLAKLKTEYGDKIMFVFRDFPLPQHKDAYLAAIASKCAAKQGKFWEYHDLLFNKQRHLKRESLITYASEIGANMETFKPCLEDKSIAKLVDEDMALANELGINATPTVFINGEKVHSITYASLKEKIDSILK